MQVGDKLLVQWREQGSCYGGVIRTVNADGTFDIVYDDGIKERSVAPDRVHLTECAGERTGMLLDPWADRANKTNGLVPSRLT